MFARPIRSCLFIDYENVGGLCPPDAIEHWVAWLEDGLFDGERKRRLVEKTVYWNPSAQKHEDKFRGAEFKIVLCEKHHKLKNGADIRMALDVAETMRDRPNIEEFILFTQDTDFVPVLQRLKSRNRKTAILVDENQARVYSTYRNYADIVIPIRKFEAGSTYQRPIKWARIKEAFGRPLSSWRPRSRAAAQPESTDPIDLAVEAVIRVTSLNPEQDTQRRIIEAELRKIPGLVQTGQNRYLGTGGYLPLMEVVAKRSDKIKLTNKQPRTDSVSVRYVPKDEEE